MAEKAIQDTTQKLVDAIVKKYQDLDQSPDAYLEGLLHANPINYWDYIQVDSLVGLQKTRTHFPDEQIFLMYHQVNELYFKMILLEIEQIVSHSNLTASFFIDRIGRINRYWDMLIGSFAIMKDGMEVEQYMQFRHTLTPASGFQSFQYRSIEIMSTDVVQLIDRRFRDQLQGEKDNAKLIEHLYWQAAGKDYKTGKKSLTLQMFLEHYELELSTCVQKSNQNNLWKAYLSLPEAERKNSELIGALRNYDNQVNIKWVMTHYRTAEHYLESSGKPAEATGGSDWKKYMHPKYQKRIFFPELWSKSELDNWGFDQPM